jgi:hypothetical protein
VCPQTGFGHEVNALGTSIVKMYLPLVSGNFIPFLYERIFLIVDVQWNKRPLQIRRKLLSLFCGPLLGAIYQVCSTYIISSLF